MMYKYILMWKLVVFWTGYLFLISSMPAMRTQAWGFFESLSHAILNVAVLCISSF
jgi:hypothetical protein